MGARFGTMDPLAEKFYYISPYVHCNGDPVNYKDDDGKFPDIFSAAISNIWQKVRHSDQYVSNIIDHGDRVGPERRFTYTTVDYTDDDGFTVISHSKFDWDGFWSDAKTTGETMHDVGSYLTIVGFGASIFCPPVGGPMVKIGDSISQIGLTISTLADYKTGGTSNLLQDAVSWSLGVSTKKIEKIISNLEIGDKLSKDIIKLFLNIESDLLDKSMEKYMDLSDEQ